jgi:hypothetical protein
MDQLDEQRAEILRMAQDGLILPGNAESWAKSTRCAPFATEPNPIRANPMEYDQWTLPMAAAWFIWRSPVAVLHQSADARVNWKRWIIIEPAKDAFNKPKCDIAEIGSATLWDVFDESRWDPRIPLLERVTAKNPAARVPDPKTDYPYARLGNALRAGTLVAMRLRAGKSTAEGVPQAYWHENFDRLAQPPQKAQQRDVEEEFFFRPEAVIKAETEIASREFETPFVGLEQALGWVAYRNEKVFRSLSQGDLEGRTYCGQSYERDYQASQPEKDLYDALVEGEIKSDRGGSELTLDERKKMNSVWDAVGMTFLRKDLKKAWPQEMPEPLARASAQPAAKIDSPHSASASGATISMMRTATARPRKQRGREPLKFKSTIAAMLRDLEGSALTLEQLLRRIEKVQADKYGVSRDTSRKALGAVLMLRDLEGGALTLEQLRHMPKNAQVDSYRISGQAFQKALQGAEAIMF